MFSYGPHVKLIEEQREEGRRQEVKAVGELLQYSSAKLRVPFMETLLQLAHCAYKAGTEM